MGEERREQILGEELPALAKEVARVETVRFYAGEFSRKQIALSLLGERYCGMSCLVSMELELSFYI